MRIVLAVTNDISTDQRVHKVALSLLRMGYRVTITGRQLPESIPLQRPYAYRRFRLWFNKGPLFYAAYNLRLFFYLLTGRYHGIIANDLDTLPAAFLASRIRRKPLLYDAHEDFTQVPELIHRPRIQRIWLALEKAILPRLPRMITVSPSIAKHFTQRYGIPVSVIRNVPMRLYAPTTKTMADLGISLPAGRKILLYQGALNKGRGIEAAIKAMQYLQGALLIIAGNGDIAADLRKMVQELKLNDKVLFTGRLEPVKLRMLTARADAGFSLEEDMGLNYRHALPNKLFDYIQAQIPVIVSALPEMQHVVESWQIGVVAQSHEPQYLAARFKELLFNKTARSQWKFKLKAAADTLSWEKEEKKLESLVEETFNKNQN